MSDQADAKRAAVQAAMLPDMAGFLAGWKAVDPEARLMYLDTPTVKFGKPCPRGLSLCAVQIEPQRKVKHAR